MRADLVRAQDQVAVLSARLEWVAGSRATSAGDADVVPRLERQLAETEAAWLEAQDTADTLADELASADAVRVRQMQEASAERAELRAHRRTGGATAGGGSGGKDRRRVHRSGRRADVLGACLADVFPRLPIDPASVDQVESEFADRRPLYALLGRLDRRESVPLESTSWPEVKEVRAKGAHGQPRLRWHGPRLRPHAVRRAALGVHPPQARPQAAAALPREARPQAARCGPRYLIAGRHEGVPKAVDLPPIGTGGGDTELDSQCQGLFAVLLDRSPATTHRCVSRSLIQICSTTDRPGGAAADRSPRPRRTPRGGAARVRQRRERGRQRVRRTR